MLVALPPSIGYGMVMLAPLAVLGPDYVGKGALAGLLGAVVLGLVAPMVGGAPRLVSSVCGPAAAFFAGFAADMLSHSLPGAKILLLISLVAMGTGLLQIVFGLLGGGKLIKYIPFPVVGGFLSGVGAILFVKQIPKLLGTPQSMGLWESLAKPYAWQANSVLIGLATIAGMVGGPRLIKRVPGIIIGFGTGLGMYGALAYWQPELRTLAGNEFVVGAFAANASALAASLADGWEALLSISTADFEIVAVPAVTLAVLLSIDTLKTCVILDTLTRSRHNSNRVLIGHGIGNFLAGPLGGMPGSGVMGGTMLNLTSGARTGMSGIFEGIACVLVFLLFSGVLPGMPSLVSWVPTATLAGVIMVVGFKMIDWKSASLLRHRSTVLDFCMILVVAITAVVSSLIIAAALGILLAFVLFIRHQLRETVIRRKVFLSQISSKRRLLAVQKEILENKGRDAVVCELQGSLFFGTTDQLYAHLADELERCGYLILDLRRVHSLDFTAGHILDQMAGMLGERQGTVILSDLPAALPDGMNLAEYFRDIGLTERQENILFFDDMNDAIEWVEDEILREAGHLHDDEGAPLELAEFPIFREFGPEPMEQLRASTRELKLTAGAALFQRGAEGDELILVRAGRMGAYLPLDDGRRIHLATFTPGSFFGEESFLDHLPRNTEAAAVDDALLFCISRRSTDELSRKYPEIGAMLFARIAKELSHLLRATDAELRSLGDS
jgi:SulP family sulfate permease